MAMTIVPNGAGGYELKQRLLRPVVYLDHWAVRKFSENAGLQDRFIELLHKSRGTWLFSAANLSEFTVVTDLAQAEAVERLLLRAMPSLYVADTVIDHGFFFAVNPEPHSNTPDQHWMLRDLGDRAAIIWWRLEYSPVCAGRNSPSSTPTATLRFPEAGNSGCGCNSCGRPGEHSRRKKISTSSGHDIAGRTPKRAFA
jgi:hypothetical protein